MTKLAARLLGLTITATLAVIAPAAARVVSVGFGSAALGWHLTNTVYLPDSQDPDGPPLVCDFRSIGTAKLTQTLRPLTSILTCATER